MANKSNFKRESNDELVKGIIRINQKRYTDAYVDNPDNGPDIFVESRGEALEGDLVEVSLNHHSKWRLKFELIVNNWDNWCDELMPIIQKISNKETNHDKSNHITKSNQRPHPVSSLEQINQPQTNQSILIEESNADFKLPSNLPPDILNLKVEHVLDLEIAPYFIQKTGVVVNLVKRNNSGIAGGFLKPLSREWVLFLPIDARKPRMLIDINECPIDFSSAPDRYSKILFIARIYEWNPQDIYARANLLKIIGDKNDIHSRIETTLLENQILDEDFPPDVYDELEYLKELPVDWFDIHSQDRRNFTNDCVISIDPKTARDLDDAVSINHISGDMFELGVHIADVSYFVREMTAVDYQARLRTTSVYLVDRVIPMLPRILCEQMCSLNPGEPKLTFSVIWKIDQNGNIKDEWFGRTVIKTCCQLSYEQAQDIINREGDISWIKEGVNMPKLHGNFDWSLVSRCIITLNTLARKLRKDRFQNGALRIDQVKLKYELDKETGEPTGFSFEERNESNYLIEEFMLLANMSVAKRIYKFSDTMAFLRRHPQSPEQALKEVKEFCDAKGYPLDISSSHTIQKSLNSIIDPTISKVVSHLLLRTMKNAEYICVGKYPETGMGFHHYALNVPFYTHFTSPIRRYADIIVHRQLSRALGYENLCNEDVNSLSLIAGECTKRKISSKVVSETSQKLYFNLFVLKAGFCELTACVTKIYDRSFDVILVDYDRIGRVHLNNTNLKDQLINFKFESFAGNRRLELNWSGSAKNNKNCETVKIEQQASTKDQSKGVTKKNRKRNKKDSAILDSRNELESVKKKQLNKQVALINEPKIGRQIIQVFDLIKVIVTVNKKDITQLVIDLKGPGQ